MKSGKVFWGIRNKLALAFFVVVVIPLFALSYFLDSIVKKQTEQDFVEATTREVVQVDKAISTFFDGVIHNTKMLANHPLTMEPGGKISVYIDKKAGPDGMVPMTPIQNGGYEAALYLMYEQFGASHPQVSVVHLGTQDGGYLQWPAIPRKAGYDSRTREWYQSAVAKPDTVILSEPFMTSKGVPTIGVFSTVKDSNGNLRGVLGLNVDLPVVTEMIKSIKIGKTGYVVLLDSKGKIIANPKNPEMNFKHIKEMKADKLDTIEQVQNGSFSIILDGVEQLANVYTSSATGWKYVILVEKTQFLESVGKIRSAMFAALLGTVILISFASYFISNQIALPIKKLEIAANRIASGEVGIASLEIRSNDELGSLGRAFEVMSRQLRELISNINRSAGQVLASSEELSAASQQSAQSITQVAGAIAEVARASNRQSNQVDRTVSAIIQMSNDVQTVASNTTGMATISEKAGTAAGDGEKAIQLAVGQMLKIDETVTNSAKVVSELGDRSKQIGSFVETISNIAGQTNLLALNAAIEAARAGEQGRGFAVVADEVRKLAEQSQEAAKQVAALVSGIQLDTARAVEAMTQGTREVRLGSEVVETAGKQFSEIVSIIGEVNEFVKEVAAGSEKIVDESQQIVSAIQEIDAAARSIAADIQTVSASTQQQSASIQQITSSVHDLSAMAECLKNAASQFKY